MGPIVTALLRLLRSRGLKGKGRGRVRRPPQRSSHAESKARRNIEGQNRVYYRDADAVAAGDSGQDRFDEEDVSEARRKIRERGDIHRDAMESSGGDREVARQIISDHQEQMDAEGMAKNIADGAIVSLLMQRLQQTLNSPMRAIDRQTLTIKDNYRGLAQSTVGEIPIVGSYAAKLIESLGNLTDAIVEKGEALAPYSGELSVAGAQSRTRALMANVEEARENGAAYARVTDEQSRLQTDLQRATMPMKKEIAEGVADGLEFLRDFLKEAKPFFDVVTMELKAIRIAAKGSIEATKATWEVAKPPIWRMFEVIDWIGKKLETEGENKDGPLAQIWNSPTLGFPPEPGPAALPPDRDGLGMGFGIVDEFR